ncbi:hypothetical protein [Thermus tengchongensis]|uniref:hypothetical protein n=1 Tax=Thermus tengchongensis TaxID=1214928 RepID=UPI0005709E69|nr:hypothetical protein [Thermus tengchongensis]
MVPDEVWRLLKDMYRINRPVAESWEKIFKVAPTGLTKTFPRWRLPLLVERFKEEAHFMGILVPGFLPKRARVGHVRGQSRAELVGVWKEAWRLVDSVRSTDPEWAMEWSVRLNRSPLEKVPILLDEMRRSRAKPVP